jgi:hypothetical protein
MLLTQLELRLPSHPLYFIFHRFLQLPLKIVTLSITTPRTKTLLRNLLRNLARAADTFNATEDDDEEEERFTDLLGGKTSGLDDLCYSDDDEDYDDEEYDDGMDEEALRIEYSDRNYVRHGRRQTNFIPVLTVCVNLGTGQRRPFPILELTKARWTCLPPLAA